MKSQDMLILAGIGVGAYLLFKNEQKGIEGAVSGFFSGASQLPGQITETLIRDTSQLIQGGVSETIRSIEYATQPEVVRETTHNVVQGTTEVATNTIAGAGEGWFDAWYNFGTEYINKPLLQGKGLPGYIADETPNIIYKLAWGPFDTLKIGTNLFNAGASGVAYASEQVSQGISQNVAEFSKMLGVAPAVATTQVSTAPKQTANVREVISQQQASNRVSGGGFNSGSGGGVVGGQVVTNEQSYTGSGPAWTPGQIASGYSTRPGAVAGTG